jgi:hypothetical protein
MATPIHIAQIALLPVNSLGVVIKKSEATIGQMTQASTEPRVITDSLIPNTATNPTPKVYLELEAADDFILKHMDQTQIITYLLV